MSRSRTMIQSGAGLGNANTAVGAGALFSNVDGDSNNAVGFNSLGANVDGLFNNAVGFDAMADNVSGAGNVAVGDSAGAGVEGDFNIYIGAFAGPAPSPAPVAESETIRIGDVFNVACFIGGISGVASLRRPGCRRCKRPARHCRCGLASLDASELAQTATRRAGIEGHN